MKKLVLILLIGASANSLAQTFTKHIEPFEKLNVSRGVEASLVKSNSDELSFEIKGLSIDDIIIEQERNTLTIKVRTKSLWEVMKENDWWVKVKVPYQNLAEISASTGAKIRAETNVVVEDLIIETNMGAVIDLEVKANRLTVDSSMGGVVKLSGETKNLSVEASMGAIIKSTELEAKYVKAKSSMGSRIKVFCSDEFDGSASMGAEIVVKGKPKKWFENTSMGGEIESY